MLFGSEVHMQEKINLKTKQKRGYKQLQIWSFCRAAFATKEEENEQKKRQHVHGLEWKGQQQRHGLF